MNRCEQPSARAIFRVRASCAPTFADCWRTSVFAGADLTNANLVEADLSKADLSGANLAGAELSGANFDGANLRGVQGLERAKGVAEALNLHKAIR